jgi:class 3 adenylate cyclase/tetratricopeptide (TPR) repeat protein
MSGTIESWLKDLDLGRYAETFLKNDVDYRALPHLTDADLRELGVSLGHRKTILAAIAGLGSGTASARPKNGAAIRRQRGDSEPAPPAPTTGAERRLLTVLFCDLVGSTSLIQQLDPEDARDLLSRYQDAVAGSVTRYGGHVAQFLGDGVLAYFGWPTAHEDHAERAVRAGLDALAAVRSVALPEQDPLRARVGIATGRVVVGDLASGREMSATGHTLNLAARLQQEAEPSQLLVTEATLRLIGETFVTEDVREAHLKGIEQPVRLYRIVAEREVDSRFDAVRGATHSPFVGRAHEVGLLLERWAAACAGQGQAVFISGEAGIGKSRLVQCLEEEANRAPHEIIRLQCSPYHQDSAFHPVIQRLARAAGFTADDTAEQRLNKLEGLLRNNKEDIESVAAVYAELLSLDTLGRYKSLKLAPQKLKEITLQTLFDRLALISRRLPALMIIEDTHWIDPSTAELLEQILARITELPVMLVVTHRPEWSAHWAAGYSHATTLSIGRLSRPQIAELVQAVMGREPGVTLINSITERTDGVPLFVEELTRAILEQDPNHPPVLDEIPATLQGSLMAGLDRLSPVARELAQVASAIGREFSRTLLKQIVGLANATLDQALSDLIHAHLVIRSGLSSDAYAFRHALIQDVAYQTLVTSKRRKYHRMVGETLIAEHPAVAETQPELIARHLSEADLPERALSFWKLAAERALARSANFEAVNHCENALRLVTRLSDGEARARESLPVRLLLGSALERAGRMPEAMVHSLAASNEARAQGNAAAFAEAALVYDNARFLSNEASRDSLALLKEARSLIGTADLSTRCHILSRLARAHLVLGDVDGANRFYRKATDEVRRLNDPLSRFELLVNRFLIPASTQPADDVREWRAQMDELLKLADELDDDDARGRARSLDIYVSAEFGDRERMDRALDELNLLGEARQRMHMQWIAGHGRAMQAILDGDFAGAERHAETALELGRRTHGEAVEGVYGFQMFTIRREQGRLADVAPIIKHLVDEDPDQPTWKPGFALVACDLGHRKPAQRTLDEFVNGRLPIAIDAKRSATLAYLAEVCAALEDRTCAEPLYALLTPYDGKTITAGVTTVCLGAAGRFLGLLATLTENWQAAEYHFEAALELDKRMGARPWLAHSQYDYAQMLRQRGGLRDRERADCLLEQSLETAICLDMVALKRKMQGTIH